MPNPINISITKLITKNHVPPFYMFWSQKLQHHKILVKIADTAAYNLHDSSKTCGISGVDLYNYIIVNEHSSGYKLNMSKIQVIKCYNKLDPRNP